MRRCDLCQRDEAVQGRILCPVCAEAIIRLAYVVRPMPGLGNAAGIVSPQKRANPRPHLAYNFDWKNYRVIWELRAETAASRAADSAEAAAAKR